MCTQPSEPLIWKTDVSSIFVLRNLRTNSLIASGTCSILKLIHNLLFPFLAGKLPAKACGQLAKPTADQIACCRQVGPTT
ncbi:hypothetical protein Y032_0051g2170 [Ancylostoma ceylanicum]|uniref:Uncharacterized protein n=1 Tax=Ancylostoma ceylanicum TaxID=53326 RepID=A0A016U859_9BILA|nr:hypothetical protein Y032_0051g2170 [Ancylostoma ceylanicum]